MVGRKVDLNIARSEPVDPKPRIEVKNLNLFDAEGLQTLKNVSMTVCGGEILGIAGVAGSGQRELLEAISGLYPIAQGSIIYHNPKTKCEHSANKNSRLFRRLRDHSSVR